MLMGKLRCDGGYFILRLSQRDTITQPGDHEEIMRCPRMLLRAAEHQRYPGLGRRRVKRKSERVWHHANHRIRIAIDFDALIQDAGIAVELFLPNPGADDRYRLETCII